MTLTAFADESGHSADPNCRHVGIVTVIADPEAWKRCSGRWSALLKAATVPFFHMRDFAHRTGAFAGWTEEARRQLIAPMLEAVIDMKPSIFGAVLSLSAWRALPSEDQALFLDPYYPCLQECGYLASIHGQTVGQSTVDFIFSQQGEFQGRALPLWELLRRQRVGAALGACRFQDPRTVVPLQVADLAAYETVLAHDQVSRGATLLRFPFRRLRECDNYFRYVDDITLRTQVAGAKGQLIAPEHPG